MSSFCRHITKLWILLTANILYSSVCHSIYLLVCWRSCNKQWLTNIKFVIFNYSLKVKLYVNPIFKWLVLLFVFNVKHIMRSLCLLQNIRFRKIMFNGICYLNTYNLPYLNVKTNSYIKQLWFLYLLRSKCLSTRENSYVIFPM